MKHRNKSWKFSEIEIGQKAGFEMEIGLEKHKMFSELVQDYSPIHWDENYFSQTGYKKQIGYGFMLTSLLSTLYGEHLPGGSSICIKQDAKYVQPYFIGDKIKVVGEVIGKSNSTNFVEISTKMYRDDDECVFKGIGTVQVLPIECVDTALFEGLYYSDFVDAIKKAGVKEGDKIFVHCDIAVFGKLAGSDRNFLLNSLIEALKESVGKGTLIFPTFTYSYCWNQVFDVQNSKSTVGVLSEHFRNMPGVIRTLHPVFSVAIWGKDKEKYRVVDGDCFGKDSIFGRLHQEKAKILFFGAEFQSGTFMHYVEQSYKVPYRYMKTFSGKIRINGREYNDSCTYFVRNLDEKVVYDASLFEKYLLGNHLINKVKIGNGEILLADADVLYNEAFKQLDKDIDFFRGDKR